MSLIIVSKVNCIDVKSTFARLTTTKICNCRSTVYTSSHTYLVYWPCEHSDIIPTITIITTFAGIVHININLAISSSVVFFDTSSSIRIENWIATCNSISTIYNIVIPTSFRLTNGRARGTRLDNSRQIRHPFSPFPLHQRSRFLTFCCCPLSNIRLDSDPTKVFLILGRRGKQGATENHPKGFRSYGSGIKQGKIPNGDSNPSKIRSVVVCPGVHLRYVGRGRSRLHYEAQKL